MGSFKSNENIHKKEDGSYYVVSANKASSVTLWWPGNESQRKHTAISNNQTELNLFELTCKMVISVIAETMRQSLHIRTCSFYRLPLARQHKETIQYLTSSVQDLMLLKYPHIGPRSIIFEVISVISVIPVISVNRRTGQKSVIVRRRQHFQTTSPLKQLSRLWSN